MPAVDARRKTRLNADLRSAQIKSLLGAPNNFFGGQKVTFFSEVPPAECTKTTGFDAYIGEINISTLSGG